MRPRVFPAEDARAAGMQAFVASTSDSASMRPRVFPAEDDGGTRFVRGARPEATPRHHRQPLQ